MNFLSSLIQTLYLTQTSLKWYIRNRNITYQNNFYSKYSKQKLNLSSRILCVLLGPSKISQAVKAPQPCQKCRVHHQISEKNKEILNMKGIYFFKTNQWWVPTVILTLHQEIICLRQIEVPKIIALI
jgi:hypothetical protein